MTRDGRWHDSRREMPQRLALWTLWAMLTLYLAWHHVFWRDEVRALSLALNGHSWVAMLRGMQGEGHPALWYILLRGVHDLVPARQVLPVLAWIIGASGALVLALRSPFGMWRIALILFGAFALYEYTVSARNYGMSMLVLFVLTDRYVRHRDVGIMLGLLLALLCNTNVHSAFIAAAVLLFWAIELLSEDGLHWTPRWRVWLVNALIAAAGAALCALTVYPPANDASVAMHPDGIGLGTIIHILSWPAESFWELLPQVAEDTSWGTALLSLLLIGAPLGLVRAPGALVSSLVLLVAFRLFFSLVYYGSYRHEALFLVYLIAMYWLVALGRGGRWPEAWLGDGAALRRWSWIGTVMFVLLLALQLPRSAMRLVAVAQSRPESSAGDLAELLRARRLDQAILVAEPDIMLEPMPYYTANRLYLMRNQRFGTVVPFTRRAWLDMSLADMLGQMQQLRERYRGPVVGLLLHPLNRTAPMLKREVNVWTFSTTPEQVRAFQAATTRIAMLRRATGDEVYDVYVLR
jgi:hypothetical protein